MKDRTLEEIRKRDADFKYLPDHYQGPKDRRYLLKVIDLLEKKIEKYEDGDTFRDECKHMMHCNCL